MPSNLRRWPQIARDKKTHLRKCPGVGDGPGPLRNKAVALIPGVRCTFWGWPPTRRVRSDVSHGFRGPFWF
jgi:hypothetical protein